MPTSNLPVEVGPGKIPPARASAPGELYRLTFVETPTVFVSVFRQIRDWWREPKLTVPPEYYRGKVSLPATDMRPWFRDLPNQLKIAFEKPRDPIGIYNRAQEKKRALCAVIAALALAAGGWFLKGGLGLALGMVSGIRAGRIGWGTGLQEARVSSRHLARLSHASSLLGQLRAGPHRGLDAARVALHRQRACFSRSRRQRNMMSSISRLTSRNWTGQTRKPGAAAAGAIARPHPLPKALSLSSPSSSLPHLWR